MVAGLVAVGVLADQRFLPQVFVITGASDTEELVQPGFESGCTAHQVHQTLRIVQRGRQAVLPGVGFGVVAGVTQRRGRRQRIKRTAPVTRTVLPPHLLGAAVPQQAVALGALGKALREVRAPCSSGHARHRVVTNAQLQGLADRFVADAVQRDVAMLFIDRPVPLRPRWRVGPGRRGRGDHCIQRLLHIKTLEAFGHRVGQHGQRWVADHRVRLAAPGRPQRQVALGAVVFQQRLHDAVHTLGHQQREERVHGTEGVPQAQRAVVAAARRLHHLAGGATHAAVGVCDVARVHEHAVQGRVENALRARWRRDGDARQQRIPLGLRFSTHAVEGKVSHRRQVAACAGHVHRGHRHAGFQGAGLPQIKTQQQARRFFSGARRQGLDLGNRPVEPQHKTRFAFGPAFDGQRAADFTLRRIVLN